MSHFVVMVIGEDPETQMIPFEESGAPEEYLAFQDEEDEELKKYQTGTTDKVVMPDGRLLNSWDDEFRVQGSLGIGSETHKVPENLTKRQVPFKEIYPTFEEYMAKWHSYESRDEKTGRYGYWHNPNAKWDYFRLGGRWTGYFNIHPNAAGTLASIDWDSPKVSRNNKADQARKGAIDFKAMMDEAGKKAQERWERLERLCGGTIPKIDRTWEEILKDDSIKDIEKKREFYHNQPGLKKIREISDALNKGADQRGLKSKYDAVIRDLQKLTRDDIQIDDHALLEKADELRSLILDEIDRSFMVWIDLQDYQGTKEEYIYNARNAAITPFAVLKDGKFYERGSMGWWGMVSDEKDKKEWSNQFATLISDLPDDTLLTIYDCHI
jgi:hypothetical protein